MAVNGVTYNNNVQTSYPVASESKVKEKDNTAESVAAMAEDEAAVYEKSEEAAVTSGHKIDRETIDRLKADAEARTAQLKGIVEKLLLKQGGTVLNGEGLASVFRRLEVDEETRRQAQEDISEDGYWGVKQTSDRIVDFAKAMAGDDPELAQKMIDAVKEGFKQAESDWGEELPELSQQTMKATFDKLEEWRKSLTGDTESTPAPEQDNTVQVQ